LNNEKEIKEKAQTFEAKLERRRQCRVLFAELRMGREMQEVQEGVQAVLLADSYDFALQPLTRWAAQPLSFGNGRYICQIILPAGTFRFQASDC
jgi:hypothetical protein